MKSHWFLTILMTLTADARQYTAGEVQGAFLYHFMNFTEWPAEAFQDPSSPVRLCIIGDDPFGADFDQTMREKKVHGRPIQVLRFADARRAKGCHVAYFGSGSGAEVAKEIGMIGGTPVLLVGSARDFLRAGGHIQFVLEEKNVRFNVNVASVTRSRLELSSRLLEVAKRVSNGPPTEEG